MQADRQAERREEERKDGRDGKGRYVLVLGYCGCAAGWGCIFTTGLTL